jgi:hypothetical protein
MGILQRGIALQRMREVAESMRSVERLKSWVREQGLGYANTLLHRDASNAWYRARSEAIQGGLNLDDPLDRGQYLRGNWSRPESYQFIGEATWYDPVNDREVIRTFSVYSNVDVPSSEITALWSPRHEEYLSDIGLILQSVDFKEKWHKIGSPYRTTLEL